MEYRSRHTTGQDSCPRVTRPGATPCRITSCPCWPGGHVYFPIPRIVRDCSVPWCFTNSGGSTSFCDWHTWAHPQVDPPSPILGLPPPGQRGNKMQFHSVSSHSWRRACLARGFRSDVWGSGWGRSVPGPRLWPATGPSVHSTRLGACRGVVMKLDGPSLWKHAAPGYAPRACSVSASYSALVTGEGRGTHHGLHAVHPEVNVLPRVPSCSSSRVSSLAMTSSRVKFDLFMAMSVVFCLLC